MIAEIVSSICAVIFAIYIDGILAVSTKYYYETND
ncbi:Polysaccharide biosynthesis protein, partial [Streptomyces clavuligerus]